MSDRFTAMTGQTMEVQGSTPEAASLKKSGRWAAQYAQQIDLYDSGAVLQYGAGVQKKMADFPRLL